MTDLRQAAQQALEALEFYSDLHGKKPDAKIIRALRQALAEPEQEPVAWAFRYDDGSCHDPSVTKHSRGMLPLYSCAATPQPEQKPVAWAEEIIEDLHALYDTEMITENDSGDALIRLHDAIACVEDAKQHYTAPTPRKPLTDEEIADLWDGHTVPVFGKTGINPIVFARAIERAHGIGEQHE